MAKWWVIWWASNYREPTTMNEFDSEAAAIKFIEEQAACYGVDFEFRVIEGREVEFVPVDVVKSWRRKS